jgi:hypothetical protein
MHPSRLFRKRFEEIRASTEAHPELFRSPNRPMPWDLLLARIRQAAAMSARENRGIAQVQRRHAPAAESTADGRVAANKWSQPKRSSMIGMCGTNSSSATK